MRRASDGYAVLAQLVERIHGKDEVTGSSPVDGSIRKRYIDYSRSKTGGNFVFAWVVEKSVKKPKKTLAFCE